MVPKGYVEKRWPSTLRLLQFRDEPGFLPQALIVAQRGPDADAAGRARKS